MLRLASARHVEIWPTMFGTFAFAIATRLLADARQHGLRES